MVYRLLLTTGILKSILMKMIQNKKDLAKMYELGMVGEKTHSVAIEFYRRALKCYQLILKKQEHYNSDSLIIVHFFR